MAAGFKARTTAQSFFSIFPEDKELNQISLKWFPYYFTNPALYNIILRYNITPVDDEERTCRQHWMIERLKSAALHCMDCI